MKVYMNFLILLCLLFFSSMAIAVDEDIFSAAESGNISKLRSFISAGEDVNARDKDGYTPLHFAVFSRDVEVLKFLLEQGADVNAPHTHSFPLHLAIISGNVEVVKFLLERGADVNARPTDGNLPLHEAIISGNVEVVKLLFEQGVDVNALSDQDRDQALNYAILTGNVEVLKFLLEQGAIRVADVINAHNTDGWPPIHYAIRRGYVELIKFLLERGIDINRSNKSGNTLLHIAAFEGHVEVVKVLLERGADINRSDKSGNTPLHIAIRRGHVEVVKFLLERGADINRSNKSGWTPLQTAIASGYEKEKEIDPSFFFVNSSLQPETITPPNRNKERRRKIVVILMEARLKQEANINALHTTRDIYEAFEFILQRKKLPRHYKLEEIPEAIARLNANSRKNEQIKSQRTYNEFRDKDPGLPSYKTVSNLFKQKHGGSEKELSNFMFGGTCEGTFDSP